MSISLNSFTNPLFYQVYGDKPFDLHAFINTTWEDKEYFFDRRPGPLEMSCISIRTARSHDNHKLGNVPGSPVLEGVIEFAVHTRLVPAKVVAEEVRQEVLNIEVKESRAVRARERSEIKQKVLERMIPRSFVDTRVVPVMVLRSYDQQYLVVDSTSTNRAEDILSFMRDAVGSIPVRPHQVNSRPEDVMARWAKDATHPGWLALNGDFKVEEPNGEADSLSGKSVSTHELGEILERGGWRVTSLGVDASTLTDMASCNTQYTRLTVTGAGHMKSIKWPEEFRDQLDESVSDLEEGQNASKVLAYGTDILIAGVLIQLFEQFVDVFGGHERPAPLDEPVSTDVEELI